jgi:glycosyltransferase involved in cell wall biosynthesis
MRLLITVPWPERLGGAEGILQMLLEVSRDTEHELEPVFFEPGPWPQELTEAGFRVEVIDAGRVRQLHRSAAAVARLARILRERRPDVLLNWSSKTHLYGAPAALLAGMRDRVLWWQHGIPRRGLDSRNWIDISARLLPTRAIGCYSEAAASAQRALRPTRRTFVVPAGAPPPPRSAVPVSLELPTDMPVVGLVGRLQAWKGQDRLLRAQALLRDRGYGFHLLLVGGDAYSRSPEYASALPRLIKSLGLEDAVTMTGQVPDAGPYIDRMDVLVNASDAEPFGIVLLEGMARGVPVVAVRAGGPAEFIDDGLTGSLVDTNQPEDLASGLEQLLKSRNRCSEMASAAQQRYRDEFTDRAMFERLIRSLEAVLP